MPLRVGVLDARVLAIVVLALLTFWTLTPRSPAYADSTTVGIDFNPSGTPANGVYGGTLPTIETCAEVVIGNTVSIDVYVVDVNTLVAFESDVQYEDTLLRFDSVNVNLFMGSQTGSIVVNDTTANVNGDDGVTVAAHDDGNISGDTGRGVLARLTFTGIGTGGITNVTIPQVDINNDGTQDTGIFMRKADGSKVNDGNNDGWFDGAWNPGPGVPSGQIAVGSDADGDGRPNYTCPGGPVDNCPGINNPGQENMDGDSLGDACDPDIDGDFYFNVQETAMGSNTMNVSRTPEVCDGADNDQDGSVDEGFDINGNTVPDCTDPTANTDGDGQVNTVDTDDDNDGMIDTREIFIRTDTLRNCMPVGQQTAYMWWADANGDRKINILDVGKFSQPFSSGATNPATKQRYDRRYDFDNNGSITILDVGQFSSVFNAQCP